jgi:hypothetical protein
MLNIFIFGELLIYISLTLYSFCALSYLLCTKLPSVHKVTSFLFASICYFLIIPLMFSLFLLYIFSILCVLCFCIVLCIVSHFVLSPTFVQVYRPLQQLGGNRNSLPTAVTGWKPYHSKEIYH